MIPQYNYRKKNQLMHFVAIFSKARSLWRSATTSGNTIAIRSNSFLFTAFFFSFFLLDWKMMKRVLKISATTGFNRIPKNKKDTSSDFGFSGLTSGNSTTSSSCSSSSFLIGNSWKSSKKTSFFGTITEVKFKM